MTILSAQSIRRLCVRLNSEPLIAPFLERTVDSLGVTFGLGPAGYDIRVAEDIRLEPGFQSFSLASSMERFCIPDFLVGIVHDKSTWARRGVALQNTICEPNWNGFLTLEISCHGFENIYIPRGTGIAQVIFYRLDEKTDTPYIGKYQSQEAGPQKAR